MSVLVRIGNRKAILRHGRWLCSDIELEESLNETTRRWIQETGGPRLEEPDQEGAVAKEMVRRFSGRLLLKTRARGRQSARYFLEQRQMELAFDGTVALSRRQAKTRG